MTSSLRGAGGRAALAGLLVLLVGCVSLAHIRQATERDSAEVRGNVGARIGAPVPAPPNDSLGELLAGEIDAEVAVKVALLNNQEVRERYEELGVARADLVQAGLLRNPVFAGNAKFFDGSPEVEMGLTRSFLDLFWRPQRQRMAGAELAEARALVAHDLVSLVFDVRRAVLNLHAAHRVLQLREQHLAAARASHQLMKALHDAGNVTDTRLTAEAVNEAQAQLDLAIATAGVKEAREPLQRLMGLWGSDTEWKLAGAFPDEPVALTGGPDLEQVESLAIRQSFDLAASEMRILAAAEAAGLQRRENALPGLEAGIATQRDPDRSKWGVGPELTFEIPLFDQGHARNAKALAVVRAEEARHIALEVSIRSAARLYRERLVSLRERATLLGQSYVPLRRRLVMETLREYNAMQTSAFEVLRVKRDQISAELDHLETLRLAGTALLDLEELLAGSHRAPSAMAESASATSKTSATPEGH